MLTFIELTWFTLLLLYFTSDILLFVIIKLIAKSKLTSQQQLTLSVIIAAKNEVDNLAKNLPFILNQNHPDFEVIVVNDQSKDDSLSLLESLAKQYKYLKIVDIDYDLKSSKKQALSQAIKVAQNEHLIFTDADCKPLDENWLSEIQNYFLTENTIILGYSPYQKSKGILNKLIRFETLQTAVNYFSFSKLGMTYMGVGRNLAYTQSLYKKLNGFQSHKHILSGDDDLLINQASTLADFRLCLDSKTFVESQPKTTFKSWISQKRRHLTTASHYKISHQIILSCQYLIRLLFWFVALPIIFVLESHHDYHGWFVITLLIGLILKWLIGRKVFKIFQEDDLWVLNYFLELSLILFQFYLFMFNLLSRKNNW